MSNQLSDEEKLQMQLDLTYNFCVQQQFPRYDTILYMQSHCHTDTETIINYLTLKENENDI